MFTPAPGMVLVKLLEDENAVMASSDRNFERMAEVLDIAPNSPEMPRMCEVGDIIFFDEYAYRRFTYQNQDYCIVNISTPGALWGVIKHASTNGEPVPEAGVSAPIQDSQNPS